MEIFAYERRPDSCLADSNLLRFRKHPRWHRLFHNKKILFNELRLGGSPTRPVSLHLPQISSFSLHHHLLHPPLPARFQREEIHARRPGAYIHGGLYIAAGGGEGCLPDGLTEEVAGG